MHVALLMSGCFSYKHLWMEKLTAQNGSIIVFLLHAESIQNIPEWNVSDMQEYSRVKEPRGQLHSITL